MSYANEHEDMKIFEDSIILKHIIYNNKEDAFYSYIPDNHVVITDINKKHQTINKTKLDIQSQNCSIHIGNIDFYCELLTRDSDDSVLLAFEYNDYELNPMITKTHLNKFVKFVEIMILGFMDHYTDYEQNPDEFFNIYEKKDEWQGSDGAW